MTPFKIPNEATIAALQVAVERLEAENAELLARITQLEAATADACADAVIDYQREEDRKALADTPAAPPASREGADAVSSRQAPVIVIIPAANEAAGRYL